MLTFPPHFFFSRPIQPVGSSVNSAFSRVPGGDLCPGRSLSRGSLSRGVSVKGVSVRGVPVQAVPVRGSPSGKHPGR